MKRISHLLLILGALFVGFVLTYWLASYHLFEFSGAGPMKDTGLLSHPRYHAPLGEVSFATEGSYTFRFSGVPSETMWLQFYMPGYSTANRENLEQLSTYISAMITDESGNVVCKASGSPSARGQENRWVLMSSSFEAAFWHEACVRKKFKRGHKYILDVSVKHVDPKSPKIILRAMLEGGGFEMP
jgi:hypothetical protein